MRKSVLGLLIQGCWRLSPLGRGNRIIEKLDQLCFDEGSVFKLKKVQAEGAKSKNKYNMCICHFHGNSFWINHHTKFNLHK